MCNVVYYVTNNLFLCKSVMSVIDYYKILIKSLTPNTEIKHYGQSSFSVTGCC